MVQISVLTFILKLCPAKLAILPFDGSLSWGAPWPQDLPRQLQLGFGSSKGGGQGHGPPSLSPHCPGEIADPGMA